MEYIDENGNRYGLGFHAAYVYAVYQNGFDRVKTITGSRKREVAQARLDTHALKHNWLPYPSVICSDCAHKAGKVWPEDGRSGFIATFYPANCDICGIMTAVTEARDYGHFRTIAELKALYHIARSGDVGDGMPKVRKR